MESRRKYKARRPAIVNWLRPAVALLIALCIGTVPAREQDGPRVGLVMSGEGPAALANVGVLRQLEDAGVRIDVIAASGLSGVVAGLYATGLSAAEVEDAMPALISVLAIDSTSVAFAPSYPINRLVIELFAKHDLSGINLDRLALPLIITSRDLNTGTPIVFSEGSLSSAIRATLSSVWLAPPLRTEGMTLVQASGVPPIGAVLEAGADIVIVVETPMPYMVGNYAPEKMAVMQMLLHHEAMTKARRELDKLSEEDLLIRPPAIADVGIDSFGTAEIIRRGYEAAEAYTARFEELARAQRHDTSSESARLASRSELLARWRLDRIRIDGNQYVPEERVFADFPIKVGDEFGMPELLAALDALNATDFYASIWPEFVAIGDGAVRLTISVEESASDLPIEALDNLIDALLIEDTDDRNVQRTQSRIFAIAAIGNMGAAAATAVDEFTPLLVDDNPIVREMAVWALGKLGTGAAPRIPDIREFLLRAKPSPLALTAADALAHLSVAAAEADRVDILPELVESMAALEDLPGAEQSIQSIRLAIQRLETIKASRDQVSSGGGFLYDAAAPDVFAGRVAIKLNGVATKVAFDPEARTVKFLGNPSSIRPGLNVIENIRFWLEDRKLTRFDTPYKSSYALVVAIDDYARRNDPLDRGTTGYDALEHMVEQARALTVALNRAGFPRQNIVELYDSDATKDAIESALREFWPGGKYAETDRLFVYFGGHGGLTSGIPYFVTYDFDRERPTATSFLMEDISGRESRNLSPKHVLFAIDACHSGLSVTTLGSKNHVEARLRNFATLSAIRRDVENPSRNLLVAGTGDQLALYKNGGIFTKALTAGLRGDADLNKDGVVQFEELAFHIRNKVTAEANMLGVRQDPESRILDAYGRGRLLFVLGSGE